MNQADLLHGVLIIIVMTLGTVITRFLPFFIFPPGKPTPAIITYLGKTLPYATMALLVVYCLREVKPLSSPHGIPEFISILLIVVLHRLKENSLLSIGAGTACYMILIQNFFK